MRLLHSAEGWADRRWAIELRLDIGESSAYPLDFYEKEGYRTFRRALTKIL